MYANKDERTSCREIKLGVVCPMANEKETAVDFVREVLEACRPFRFQAVCFYASLDNVSKDGTLQELEALSAQVEELKVLYSPQNKNVVEAYKKGYHKAMADGCHWILEIDAGYSHRPEDIAKFISAMEAGYDCVFGSRFLSGGKMVNSSLKRVLLSYGGTLLTNALLGTRLKDMTSGFELFKKEALLQILRKGVYSTGPFFQTEIRALAHAFKIIEVPIIYDASTGGQHQNALGDALRNLVRLFTMRLKNELYP